MSDSGIGFGGFLLGLGGGYYLFKYVDFTFDIISYLLILMGAGIIIGSLLSKGRKNPIGEVWGGFIGGLFFAVFLTQGFGLVDSFTNQWDDVEGSIYRATEDVSLTAEIEAATVSLSVDSVNGAVDVTPWSGDDVKIDLEIRAKGTSDSDAEDKLADFVYDLANDVSGGEQEIALTFPMSTLNVWNTYSVYIEVFVPEDAIDTLMVDTTNGAITVSDLDIPGINLDTTNGAIHLSDVTSSLMTVDTTNGGISGTIYANTGVFSTTNGAIDITLEAESGEYNFDTTNGSIEIDVPSGDNIGVNLNLDTTVGSIDVNLPDIDYSINRSREKIGETTGYDSKTVQIVIDADTTIGGIELN